MILIGVISRVAGLSLCDFCTEDQGKISLIITDNVPMIPYIIEYEFECGTSTGSSYIYANRLIKWRPIAFCDAVAKALYEGVLGVSHLFYKKPPMPLERFIAHCKPPVPDPSRQDAYIWENFGWLALLAKLSVQGWQLYPRPVLNLLAAGDFLALTYRHDITFIPEMLACYLGEGHDDLIEDVRFLNHLRICTAEYGLIVSAEQGEYGYQQRDNTELQRLNEKGYIVRGNRQVSLTWAWEFQQRLSTLQHPLPILDALPSALPALLTVHTSHHRLTLINSGSYDATCKELRAAYGDQITIYAATMLIEDFFKKSIPEGRVAIVGNRDVHLGKTLAAMTGEWFEVHKPKRIIKTLLTMTKNRAHSGQVIQLYEFRTQERIDQLKELLGDPGKRVLFVFAYPPSLYERSRFFGGSVYRSSNYMARFDAAPFTQYQIITRWPKKITTGDGELVFIQGLESIFMPLHACDVSLLPHLNPIDFDTVVLFTDGATRAVWRNEAVRVGSGGNVIIY